jgi:hypothetical protein
VAEELDTLVCDGKTLRGSIAENASGAAVKRHGTRPRPSQGPAPRDLDARGRMDRKIRSKAGQAIDALRKIIDEPVIGQIKDARGLDRFPLRGTEKTFGELNLMAITHNLLNLHRAALNTA